MNRPSVYIEQEPLLTMIAASVEVYNRECFGYLFGYEAKDTNAYFITSAMNLAAIVRRTNAEIRQSAAGCSRMADLFAAAGKLFPYIGDFHSHPSLGSLRPTLELSDSDLVHMASDKDCRIGIVVAIAHRGKRRMAWELRERETSLRGTLGKFNFQLAAYRTVRDGQHEPLKDDRGIPRAERLILVIAPSTLEALNRAKS